MRTVGVRELKDRLSEYLRLVRAGEEILVTDRNEVIAELVSPRLLPGEPPQLARLVRTGQATAGAKNRKDLYPKMARALKSVRSSALLDEERGER
jgi:prevent-host-death family protein